MTENPPRLPAIESHTPRADTALVRVRQDYRDALAVIAAGIVAGVVSALVVGAGAIAIGVAAACGALLGSLTVAGVLARLRARRHPAA